MTSSRPYLVRALHDWIVDSSLTPYLVVDATMADVIVPMEFVEDGQIILNLSPGAIRGLEIGNDWLLFNARFGGKPMDVSVPVVAIRAIYAQETGQGMSFLGEEPGGAPTTPGGNDGGPPDDTPDKPGLRLVK